MSVKIKPSKPVVQWDEETKISIIRFNNHKVAESDSRGNCVIDFDQNGQVCQIEILPFNVD